VKGKLVSKDIPESQVDHKKTSFLTPIKLRATIVDLRRLSIKNPESSQNRDFDFFQ
jgi:hypothetical protein